MDTQTQIERLIDLAIIQRSELKKLVSELPQLREHLNAEIERVFEDAEPQLRTELEDWTTKQAKDQTAKLGGELEAKIAALSKSLEATTQTRYNAIMAERAQNIDLAKKAEDKLAEVAQAIPVQVKQIVTDELARFPRAGEIDQLRKEFAEPRGLNPRGRWQVGDTYNKLDLVSYNGDSYVSNTDGNREKPSRSSETWTLSAARGNGGAGGGVTSLTDLVAVPANGELLIGNGSAFVNNTITGGTGVTVTNGPGTITIDASGAQEILTATVTNAESVAITRGQVVYLFGATGNRASVKLANNATDAESSKTFGVVSEASIAAGANGLVTCVGVVDKLTLGSYTEGDVLYLGATPGAVTNVKPYAPNHLVYVGMVERANNGNGELYVRIQNGFELDEIHDVQITTPPLAGSLLMRDATTSLWKANRLTGTANQVTVTNADTSVTLSLPTAIANVNSVTAATTQNLTLAGGSTGASLVLGQGASGNLVMSANSAERARLTATGNLLIGTTTDGGQKLQVNGTASFAGAVTVAMTSPEIAIRSASDAAGQNQFLTFGSTNYNRAQFKGVSAGTNDGSLELRTFNAGAQTLSQTWNKDGSSTFAGAVTAGGNFSVAGTLNNVVIGKNTDFPNYNTISLNGSSLGVAAFTGFLAGDNTDKTFYIQVGSGGGGMQFNTAGNTSRMTISNAGLINVTNTTPSTGAGSGALQVAGGIYAGAASVFGSSIGIGGAPYFSAKLTVDGNVIVAGSLGVAGARGGPITNIYNDGGTTSTSKAFQIGNSSGTTLATFEYGGNVGIGTTTPATKLDVNGAATFAGAVTTTSTGFSAINASGSVEFIGSRSSTGTGVTVTYKTGATLNWFHGLRGLVDNNWYLFNNGTSTNTLIFDYGTNAATFAGTVIAPAATTAISSVRLPHGAAPTSPVNGDMWTTTAGLYVRINGVTVGPLS